MKNLLIPFLLLLTLVETGSAQTPALNRMKPGLSIRDILCIGLEKMDVNIRYVKTEEYEGYILERKNEPNPLTLQDIQYIEQVTRTLMENYLSEQLNGSAGIPCEHIADHYPFYVRQYMNTSTETDAIIEIRFIAKEDINETTDFTKQLWLYHTIDHGYHGMAARINLTKNTLEDINFY